MGFIAMLLLQLKDKKPPADFNMHIMSHNCHMIDRGKTNKQKQHQNLNTV